jgi:translation initiation factor IF-1
MERPRERRGDGVDRSKKAREIEGSVEEELPGALYRVRTDDGLTFVAGLPASSKHGLVKVARGDRVLVAVSGTDRSRARILKKQT